MDENVKLNKAITLLRQSRDAFEWDSIPNNRELMNEISDFLGEEWTEKGWVPKKPVITKNPGKTVIMGGSGDEG
jgi:hypothetical protein